jgi:hypothetical protein
MIYFYDTNKATLPPSPLKPENHTLTPVRRLKEPAGRQAGTAPPRQAIHMKIDNVTMRYRGRHPIMVCSKCHQAGHNARTCSSVRVPPVPSIPIPIPIRIRIPVPRVSRVPDSSIPVSVLVPVPVPLPVPVSVPVSVPLPDSPRFIETINTECKERMSDEKDEFSASTYNEVIAEIVSVSKGIGLERATGDGRMDSAIKEIPFLNELKRNLLEKHTTWKISISPPRGSCDIIINSIKINLKLTDCKSSDNCVNKSSIYYSITGDERYPYSSNWNIFLEYLLLAKENGKMKRERCKWSEYHYLVKNKLTGDVLLKPIFDIHTYVSNASNDLQINWKNEFAHYDYYTEDEDYIKKVEMLLRCLQTSVREMIARTQQFADADIGQLIQE